MSAETSIEPIDLKYLRRIFARQLMARAGIVDDTALEAAFASVAREEFLGPPPWSVLPAYYARDAIITSDPVLLYQDLLVRLQERRRVNTGAPGIHAAFMHAIGPRSGDRVVHIGAGNGYYTAILSRLVGSTGYVVAIEFDNELAQRARSALAGFANVEILQDDGSRWPQQPADIVYVNCGANRPADRWIDNLAEGGRLVFQLTAVAPHSKPSEGGSRTGAGAALIITRRTRGFAVRNMGPVQFVQAEGELAGSPEENARLFGAFKKGAPTFVRSMKWHEKVSDPGRFWHIGRGWALGYDEV